MRKLSLRLQTIFDQLELARPVWDLCCDHGLLGIAALEAGHFPEVYFVDQLDHAIERLRHRWQSHGKAHFLATPCEDIGAELFGNVVIAGIGAERILNIIGHLESRGLMKASVLVLGPQKDEVLLEPFLRQKESFYSIKVLSVPEGHRQRLIYVLRSKHNSRMD